MKTGMKTGRKPKPENEKQSKNRGYIYKSDRQLQELGVKNGRELSALSNTLLDVYAKELNQPKPTSQKG